MEKEYQKLVTEITKYQSISATKKIEKAWEFTKLAHTGQKRKSGEDYAMHPLHVALILSSWKLDSSSIIAGLLHDTVEDGGATREDLTKEFGEEIAILVDGVTNVANLRLNATREERFIENSRKMVLFMAKDIRVVVIKLADRLHNMRTLYALAPEKQRKIAIETLNVFAPLAGRLGMGEVKGELEDLAFMYVYPSEYSKILEESKIHYKEAEKHIKRMKQVLLKSLASQGIIAHVHGRKKHLYSLWKKLERPGISWEFDKIHDIVALRIIVDTVPQCYTALGMVHLHYRPVPALGISDFISQPKPNGYQSIHTKVFGSGGRIVEVQIRTTNMHQHAEHGIAAHWAYSQAKSGGASEVALEKGTIKVDSRRLGWVKELVRWQEELTDSDEFLSAVKFDALNHRNFVFSPRGDVFDLPGGASVIDFAYAVHTKFGKFIQGARVNGKIVPLNYKLQSGDVVEIIKSKNPKKPNRDWINFAVTTLAKREIAKELRREQF